MNANPYYLAKMVMRVGEVLNATLRAGFSLHHFCSKSSRIPNIARREQTPWTRSSWDPSATSLAHWLGQLQGNRAFRARKPGAGILDCAR